MRTALIAVDFQNAGPGQVRERGGRYGEECTDDPFSFPFNNPGTDGYS
jgi:hypothetical protein